MSAVIQHVQSIDNLDGMSDRKLEGIFVRVSIREKKILQKVAAAAQRRVSEWVRLAAMEKAEQDLAQSPSEDKPKKKE